MTIVAFTGHRPVKLLGYSDEARDRLRAYARNVLSPFAPLGFQSCQHKVISGMALGWDMAIAGAAVDLRIPLIAAVPFVGHHSKWVNDSDKMEYLKLSNAAERIEVVSPGGYSADKMQVRNEWMVNNCSKLGALWDGSEGGTFNCVKYAERIGKPIVHFWNHYQRYMERHPV